MVNMRAGLPRLGTVCDEYRLGDTELGAPLSDHTQRPRLVRGRCSPSRRYGRLKTLCIQPALDPVSRPRGGMLAGDRRRGWR
jgi:hypothetical protein